MAKENSRRLRQIEAVAAFAKDVCNFVFEDAPADDRPQTMFVHKLDKTVVLRFTVPGTMSSEGLDALEEARKAVSSRFRVKAVCVCHVGLKWSEKAILGHVNDVVVSQGFGQGGGDAPKQ